MASYPTRHHPSLNEIIGAFWAVVIVIVALPFLVVFSFFWIIGHLFIGFFRFLKETFYGSHF